MFAQYFEYDAIILREGIFSWTHCVYAVHLEVVV